MQPSNPYEYRAPQLVSQTHYCVMGDVTVADNVMIAPGVVLQAAPKSRIVIESGACLAGGVCVQSRGGVLTVGANANLGANVLVIGYGEIGSAACVSPGSTLVNPSVEADALLPPGSLVNASLATTSAFKQPNSASQSAASNAQHNGAASGFTASSYVSEVSSFVSRSHFVSRGQPYSSSANQVTNSQQNDSFVNTYVEPPPVGPRAIETPSLSDQNGEYIDPLAQSLPQDNGVQLSHSSSQESPTHSSHTVYGKDQVSQLISTLFPNRQS